MESKLFEFETKKKIVTLLQYMNDGDLRKVEYKLEMHANGGNHCLRASECCAEGVIHQAKLQVQGAGGPGDTCPPATKINCLVLVDGCECVQQLWDVFL